MAFALRGTTAEQDGRWGKSDANLIAKMTREGKFAPILDTKVDLKKVNLDIISKWVQAKITEILGFEDEIIINLVVNMLNSERLEGKMLQLNVTGFLEKQAGAFCTELWTLLADAQNQPTGIPSAFIQQKKAEILRRDAVAASASVPQEGTRSTAEHTTQPPAAARSNDSARNMAAADRSQRKERSPSTDQARSGRNDRDDNRSKQQSERSGRGADREDNYRRRSPARRSRSPNHRNQSYRRDRSRSRDDRGSRYGDRRWADRKRGGSRSRSGTRSRSPSNDRRRSGARRSSSPRRRDRSSDRNRRHEHERDGHRHRRRSPAPSHSPSRSPSTSRRGGEFKTKPRDFHSPSRTPSVGESGKDKRRDSNTSDVNHDSARESKHKKHKKDSKKKSKSSTSRRSRSASEHSSDERVRKDKIELRERASSGTSECARADDAGTNEEQEHRLRELALKSILLAKQQQKVSSQEA